MTFKNYYLDRILPAKKEKFETVEEFFEKFKSNVSFLQFKEPGEKFNTLINTLYGLDNEKYNLILKKVKMDYAILRRNTAVINTIITNEEDPIDSLNRMVEIYKIKSSVINRMISNMVNSNSSVDDVKKCIENINSEGSLEVEVCEESLKERYRVFNDNPILKKYCDKEIETVKDELILEAKSRLKKILFDKNKYGMSELDKFKEESKKRFHRK